MVRDGVFDHAQERFARVDGTDFEFFEQLGHQDVELALGSRDLVSREYSAAGVDLDEDVVHGVDEDFEQAGLVERAVLQREQAAVYDVGPEVSDVFLELLRDVLLVGFGRDEGDLVLELGDHERTELAEFSGAPRLGAIVRLLEHDDQLVLRRAGVAVRRVHLQKSELPRHIKLIPQRMQIDENLLKSQANALDGMSDEQLRMMMQSQGTCRFIRNECRPIDAETVGEHDEEHVSRAAQVYD